MVSGHVVEETPNTVSLFLSAGFKCPVCSKFVSSEEMDLHLVLCLTKPRVTYNGTADDQCLQVLI